MIRLLERRCPVCAELVPVGYNERIEVYPICNHCGHTLRPLARCECLSCQGMRRVLTRQGCQVDESLVH